MDKDIVYEDYLLVCEAGAAICQLKCHNKMSVDVGGKCSIPFGIATTADNKEENIGSLDEEYFGMCLYKGKCDLQVLGEWTKQHESLYIGSSKALLIDSKLPCNISLSTNVSDMRLSKLKQFVASDNNMTMSVNATHEGDPSDITASGGQLSPGSADITITGTKYISIFKDFDSAMGMMANSRVLQEKAEGDLINAATIGAVGGTMMLLFPQVGAAIGSYAAKDMAFSSILIGGTLDNLKSRYDKYKDLERKADTPEMKEFWSRQFWLEAGAEYGPMMLVGAYQAGPAVKSKFTELKAYYSRGLSEEEMILYGLRNNGATVAAGKSVEGGVIGDDGRFYTALDDELLYGYNEAQDAYSRILGKRKFSELSVQDQRLLAREFSKRSPVKIPENAKIKVQTKLGGYEQISYRWRDANYKYEIRWHTRTPGAPADQGNTWVVMRETPGTGGNTKRSYHYLLDDNTWVTGKEWYDAIDARGSGMSTLRQIEILNMGHWSDY
ncbi:Uncharacterised protein [Sebaldella termitidis]|uniref:DUF4280 domain-containing protein n=1 Tax=Sebaldella termitidis (strain ATCC 33386 / NCTC 11300) TaxID=526218 RepID=D1AM23_SEBTE|nr:PAAR-like protein [Sebaldella termitidis]ACZ07291.1 hypothetical protein Sterm_0409 [Sebaldella termitidis ATCC 33386]SUI22584.1 Uncharacterised protein [Sebaldella termitidis]